MKISRPFLDNWLMDFEISNELELEMDTFDEIVDYMWNEIRKGKPGKKETEVINGTTIYETPLTPEYLFSQYLNERLVPDPPEEPEQIHITIPLFAPNQYIQPIA